jgi:hypothetical protein
MRKWLVTACTCKSPRTSNAAAITPVSASATRMRRATRSGAMCRGRRRTRPGLANTESGLVAIGSGYYAVGLRKFEAVLYGG